MFMQPCRTPNWFVDCCCPHIINSSLQQCSPWSQDRASNNPGVEDHLRRKIKQKIIQLLYTQIVTETNKSMKYFVYELRQHIKMRSLYVRVMYALHVVYDTLNESLQRLRRQHIY